MAKLNLLNKTFGKLIVEKATEKRNKSGEVILVCKCECGTYNYVSTHHLTSNHTSSCGRCIRTSDFTNLKQGMIRVLGKSKFRKTYGNAKRPATFWDCQCDCGNSCVMPTCRLLGKHPLSCGCVRSSIGEKLIENYLNKNIFTFKREYRFVECRNKRPLPFDFCIKINDKTLLVEFQGEHHYKIKPRFGGKKELKKRQFNDKIKADYCTSNNLSLLVIPYWNINKIGDLLDEFIRIS